MNTNSPPSGFILSTHSQSNLVGVDRRLIAVVEGAAEATPIPFIVAEGVRSASQQLKDWLSGHSRFNGIPKGKTQDGIAGTGMSKHQLGLAVDLVPLAAGQPSWDWTQYYILMDAVRKVGDQLGTRLRWGGAWNEPLNTLPAGPAGLNLGHLRYRKLEPQGLCDGPHVELED